MFVFGVNGFSVAIAPSVRVVGKLRSATAAGLGDSIFAWRFAGVGRGIAPTANGLFAVGWIVSLRIGNGSALLLVNV
jgi:hypothetical protein